jgi:hypothetical protein
MNNYNSTISSMTSSLLESVVRMNNYNSTISSMASSLLESVVQMNNYNSTISSMASSLLESVVQMNNYNSKSGWNNTFLWILLSHFSADISLCWSEKWSQYNSLFDPIALHWCATISSMASLLEYVVQMN